MRKISVGQPAVHSHQNFRPSTPEPPESLALANSDFTKAPQLVLAQDATNPTRPPHSFQVGKQVTHSGYF